jgi:hypothetical protein
MRLALGWSFVFSVFLVTAPAAFGNDRLPDRWQAGYGTAIEEARNYARYILARVWRDGLVKLRQETKDRTALRSRADETTDEIVHLLLPQSRRIVRDALFGTDSTHLRILRPDLREKALEAAMEAVRARRAAPRSVYDALSGAPKLAEESLEDRLEQALTEDLEHSVQEWVETAVGLPLRGRGRARTRALPEKWEKPYAGDVRLETHRFTYWWLRKRKRLPLTHMAQTMRREQIDRARHEGPVWRMTSGISQDTWAQNRLRIDFKWGRHNWEIDRRRIRRRMDQDLAQATWSMARMAKELTDEGTVKKLRERFESRLREELEKEELKQKAQSYPKTRPDLEQALDRVRRELDPLMDEAIDRVPFPKDMQGPLSELAREHGRRFMHEEMRGMVKRSIARAAAPHAASKRVKDRLPELVAPALARLDPGRAAEMNRDAVKARVREGVKPQVIEEINDALRATGAADLFPAPATNGPTAADQIYEQQKVDRAVDREIDRQLDERTKGAP